MYVRILMNTQYCEYEFKNVNFCFFFQNFLDNFSIAKAKLDEAGQAMKEASKDVAKNLQEKAPRVKLDVMVSKIIWC